MACHRQQAYERTIHAEGFVHTHVVQPQEGPRDFVGGHGFIGTFQEGLGDVGGVLPSNEDLVLEGFQPRVGIGRLVEEGRQYQKVLVEHVLA